MKQNNISGQRKQSREVKELLTRLTYDDVDGIDGDIERLIGHVQRELGCNRDRANAELVRKLSFAA